MGYETDEASVWPIVVGLGNPGPRYSQTYHNLGFMAIDEILTDWPGEKIKTPGGQLWQHSVPAPLEFSGIPNSFVNRSGESIKLWLKKLNLTAKQLLVIYDDLALDVGRIRLRPGGSSGGHGGIKSIIGRLGTEDFPRLRIGIGPVPGGVEGRDYVLSRVTEKDRNIYQRLLPEIPNLVKMLAEDGLDRTMNHWNGVDFS